MTKKTIAELKNQNDIPVIVADHQGVITYINPIFEKTYLWPFKKLAGRLLVTIIPTTLHDAHHLGFSRFLTTEKPTLLEKPLPLAILLGDGTEIAAEHTIYAEKENGNWVFCATITPQSSE